MEDFLGCYYIIENLTKREAHEYTLEIFQVNEKEFGFKFELSKSGHFGSVGTDWTGTCVIQDFEIKFNFLNKIDWRYTFLHEEREDMPSKISKSHSAYLKPEGKNIQLTLFLETKKLIMFKVEKEIERLTYLITREIQKLYDLEAKAANSEKFRFWCISNLIVKNYLDNFRDKETLEVICEYDLDFVKEEKRVVDADEVIREHHIDRFVFNNKYQLI